MLLVSRGTSKEHPQQIVMEKYQYILLEKKVIKTFGVWYTCIDTLWVSCYLECKYCNCKCALKIYALRAY